MSASAGKAMDFRQELPHRERQGVRGFESSCRRREADCRSKIGERGSKSHWPHLFEFVVACVAEALQQIDRAIDGHFTQFDEALVRLQIGVQDLSSDVFGTMDHLLRRHRPHRAQLRVNTDQAGNIGFIVLERIDVAFGGVFDEIPVQGLPAALLVQNPLDADLASVVQPSRNSARQAADSCSGEGGERRDDRDVHRCNPQPAAESGSDIYSA